ncbi:MAG TPA: hypothetical protein VNE38_03545 [Ktedonobacteraceae bacterium]|nr:hypothetical protein [Ktedonobacteraceae bacterium]
MTVADSPAKQRLWLWITGGILIGLLVVAVMALLILPGLRRVHVRLPVSDLSAAFLGEIIFPAQPLAPQPALTVAPAAIKPGVGACSTQGTISQCNVTLSAIHIPAGGIIWQPKSTAPVTVNPTTGLLTPLITTNNVTISGLPCATETITFTGKTTLKGVVVTLTPVTVTWTCTPGPTPTPSPTPSPSPSPTIPPTLTPSPTPSPAITPSPSPTSSPSPTPSPTITPSPTATVIPTSPNGPTNTGGSSSPNAGGSPGILSAGSLLLIAAMTLALLALLLYLLPQPQEQKTLSDKLRSLIIPDSLRRR